MKITQRQASVRLFKKLSALRATLPNEERAILDSLILVDEVSAHRMSGKTVSKSAGKSANKAAEVQAHKLTTRAVGKVVGKVTSKAAEVQAHKMTTKAAGKAAGKSINKVISKNTFRVSFDPDSEEYKVRD